MSEARALKVGLLGMPDNRRTPQLIAALAQEGVRLDFVVYWQPSFQDQRKRTLRKLRNDGLIATVQRIAEVLARRLHPVAPAAPAVDSGEAAAPRAYFVPGHNSDECRAALEAEAVDILLLATDAIIRRKILSVPRVATLNAHPAWLPRYRGLGSPVYQLLDGYLPAVSVHQVDEGVDTGAIFVRRSFDFDPAEGMDALDARTEQFKAHLLAEVVRRLEQGDRATLDTFLEPSRMTRGVSPRARARLNRLLRSDGLKLRPPEADFPDG